MEYTYIKSILVCESLGPTQPEDSEAVQCPPQHTESLWM